ncbi:MAG: ABC transporter permease [Gammaproteobacteria bacterium]|nr:ABC transporter permease [Gammaproteobacteria bacterium]MDH4315823.1 ABC transporter permease [Gammaproteobacteria bacterium]MDH5215257.1 ABC transporter permease [Gammaproteobacteria bacterium]MDH5502378.1 ABC transporter permease [Gammaproteobacteria bacterium]
MSWVIALRRIVAPASSNRLIVFSVTMLVAITILAIAGPLLSPHSHFATNLDGRLQLPTLAGWHLFGTDELGRDLFVRTLQGTRVTLLVAIVASAVSFVIGVSYGAIAGFVGGKTDAIMMRIVDVMYALPYIFFVILLMVVFERSLVLVFIAIGAVNWLDMARIVRGQTMSLREKEFVDAARLFGVSRTAIIFRHILPNLLGTVVVYLTLTIPQAILMESFLSFLGLGVQEPDASLGTLVNAGVGQMEQAPWMLLVPATLLALMLFCFNFLGDGLRDLADPRKQK